jgi:hypothetical protein
MAQYHLLCRRCHHHPHHHCRPHRRLMVILTHLVEFGLGKYFHDQLFTGLNYSLQSGIPLLQLLDGFFVLLARRL